MSYSKNEIIESISSLEQLILYRDFTKNDLLAKIKTQLLVQGSEDKFSFSQIINELVEFNEKLGLKGDIFKNYLKGIFINDQNSFSLTAEKNTIAKNSSLYQLAYNDIEVIRQVLKINFSDLIKAFNLKNYSFLASYQAQTINNKNLKMYNYIFDNQSKLEDCLKNINNFYQKFGTALLNQSSAFYWKNSALKLVKNPDKIRFEQIIAYQKQQDKLINNTKSFLNDKKAHNVLLYGDSGTGKSSSVKALLNEFQDQGLRLIEINSSQIKELSEIMEYLSQRGLYFIIFMDDLSFEEFETDYKDLKAIMEGGIESKPDNVLFYATSNRRHLVREKWQDRKSEVHKNDILNEKLSLAERFGLTLMYNNPDQEKYLKIVREIAAQEDIDIEASLLEDKALKWSKWHNGRSGRTARQFIDQLLKLK
ncbi:ATP-binding protein [Halanaerobium sp. Z-7514]|uniref:ATP-binding protein n=1 Tax=Halanaerobium polyolivorans TaxID=2886943 RepID=A0AAW4WY73_9FIRM|nr:ATP-binding protein [Halanaerobium polyolivorans]MCC3143944.1 ATP-binding protein [Halanaerobium polyolivorans]